MHEVNGICYADSREDGPRIVEATPLSDGMLLVTFLSGERRLFDTTKVEGPAFTPLRTGLAQHTIKVEHGFISWLDGSIDLAPEYVYSHSICL